jgi:arylsulfatase A-like enzyme
MGTAVNRSILETLAHMPAPFIRFRVALLTSLALNALVASGLSGEEIQGSKSPRLVILYATCSLGRSFLEPYDSTVSYTPNLQTLASRGTVFERHQTESGQSGISYASIFTGLQAADHGVYSHPSELVPEVRTIAESFAESGWETYAYLSHGMARNELNYDQGVPADRSYGLLLSGDEDEFSELLNGIKLNPSRRAFVMTNFTYTHAPYKTAWVRTFCKLHPAECKALRWQREAEKVGKLMTDHATGLTWRFDATMSELGYGEQKEQQMLDVIQVIYKSNVWRLDLRFGQLLVALESAGLTDDTMIAFTADHGEILHREGSHLSFTHGMQLAPEVLNVPLILFGPSAGVPIGRYPGVTRSIDVAWTLLGLSGIDVPPHLGDGRDLTAAIRGEKSPPDLIAYSHTALSNDTYWKFLQRQPIMQRLHPTQGPESMWVGARRGDTLFQHRRALDGQWKNTALDLAEGPGGPDRFDPKNKVHREMVGLLAEYKKNLTEHFEENPESESQALRERHLRLLQHMGYIETPSGESPPETRSQPESKSVIPAED